MSNFRSTGEFFLPSRVSPEKTQLTKFHKRGVSSCNLAVSKENTWFRWHPSVIPVCQLLRHNLHLHFQVCDLSVSRVYSNRTTPAVNIESSSTTWEFPRFIPPPPHDLIWPFQGIKDTECRSVQTSPFKALETTLCHWHPKQHSQLLRCSGPVQSCISALYSSWLLGPAILQLGHWNICGDHWEKMVF